MSASPGGIQNFSEMDDKNKAYLVKLLSIMVLGVIIGFVTGTTYDPGNSSPGSIGFLSFIFVELGLSYLVKRKYDLRDMSDTQIFRHGIALSLLIYIFIWAIIFNFLII